MSRRTTAERQAEAALYQARSEASATTHMVSTSQCHYDKGRKVLRMSSKVIGMPSTFHVRSHHTGKIVRFVPGNPADSLYDEDQWDGEQQIYRPVYSCLGVDHFVIYNQ